MVTVEGRGMMGVPGIAARTFGAVASQGASVLMISQASSEQSICFVIPTVTAPAVIRAVEAEMALELARRDVDRVWALDDVVIVTAVGAGMRGTSGIAARLFSALGENGINVVAIAQGASECGVSLVVSADDAAEAVLASSTHDASALAQKLPRIFLVSDGHPLRRREFFALLAQWHDSRDDVSAEIPSSLANDRPPRRRSIGSKRVDNSRMLRELGDFLSYPSVASFFGGQAPRQ